MGGLTSRNEATLQDPSHCGIEYERSARLLDIGVIPRPVRPPQLPAVLLNYVTENIHMLNDVILALLPSHDDAVHYMPREDELLGRHYMIITQPLLWLVLGRDPSIFLAIAEGVLHVVYHPEEIVYECKTCARGPHRSICTSCFDHKEHSGHDYRSVVVKVMGRCDCGDENTWLGGSSKHTGPNHTAGCLDENVTVANTFVFDLLFSHWKNVLDQLLHGADAVVVNQCNQIPFCFVSLFLSFLFVNDSCIGLFSSQLSSTGLLESLFRHERYFTAEAWDLISEFLFTLLANLDFRIALSEVLFQHIDTLLLGERRYRLYDTFVEEILTVPSVALHLVKEINLLGILFDSIQKLLSSCASKDGQLQVTEWSTLYKTTLILMQATRSVLSHVEVVTYTTREQLDNYEKWMRVLCYIQGMAPLQRCTGEHVREEDENRHNICQFGSIITDIHSLLVDGLCSFSEVVKFSHQTLRAIDKWMVKCVGSNEFEDRAGVFSLLSEESWPCFDYDVSSQDISVHIPLHRLLSLIIAKSFREWIGNNEGTKAFELFHGDMLQGCHQIGFSSFIMEHPLRVKVFCSQVRAGMWRKNGDAAVLNVKQCQSAHWSELDIFLLQCCAASAPPNLFVTRVLHRFGLSNYLSLTSEDTTEYEPVLVEEMLSLLLHIIKERRFCGFSEEKTCKRDLICKLAVSDAKHSELLEFCLPTYLSSNFDVERIITEVADFSLRANYWKHLDIYHPRWNPRDAQKAEARYMDILEDTNLAILLRPKWEVIIEPLQSISEIATSRSLLEIIRAVIYYSSMKDKPSELRPPYKVILISLHLLLIGLEISEMKIRNSEEKEDALRFLALASEEISVGPSAESDAVKKKTLLSLLISIMKVYEVEQCDLSGLIKCILEKFGSLSVCCTTELQKLAGEVVPVLMLHPFPNSGFSTPSSSSDAEERKLKARARQAATMENMKAAQSKFMELLVPEENLEAEVRSNLSGVSIPTVCSICQDSDSKDPLFFLVLFQKSRLANFVERVPPVWGKSNKECLSSSTGDITEPRKGLQSGLEAIPASNIEQLIQNTINKFSRIGFPVEVEGMMEFFKAHVD
ncbi:hypothetical protein MKW94_010257, partial [Papaver nudicaule]|nr:hypothetical protein [Papaver nudicaule]